MRDDKCNKQEVFIVVLFNNTIIQNQCLQIFHIITFKVHLKKKKKSSDVLNAKHSEL